MKKLMAAAAEKGIRTIVAEMLLGGNIDEYTFE